MKVGQGGEGTRIRFGDLEVRRHHGWVLRMSSERTPHRKNVCCLSLCQKARENSHEKNIILSAARKSINKFFFIDTFDKPGVG